MDQRNETFVPHVLAIIAGTTVDFPNSDHIYHNVFSLSKTKSFDLGRYAVGPLEVGPLRSPGHRPRLLRHPFAHERVHPRVRAIRYFAVTDDDGRYRRQRAAGHLHRRRLERTAPLESRRVVVPDAGGEVELDFALGR